MRQDTQNGIKLVNLNVDLMLVFVITNKDLKMINADVNANN